MSATTLSLPHLLELQSLFVLQIEPGAGTLTQFLGTLVAGWLLFSFTAHVAATYVLGDVPWKRAFVVGVVPAIVTVALVRYNPLVIIAVGLLADFAAVHVVYHLKYRTAGLVVVMHYVVSLALVLLAANLLALLSTAPV
ncbi:DUF7473 family protein [Halobacterium zhouii]|uniref:DUF7473 family protein n=1 Tax=Halobacterium zhouii TaxID=2902624 RepID=UPI001E2A741F|nr:hypothetical protein [Halobacterium zhouii]